MESVYVARQRSALGKDTNRLEQSYAKYFIPVLDSFYTIKNELRGMTSKRSRLAGPHRRDGSLR